MKASIRLLMGTAAAALLLAMPSLAPAAVKMTACDGTLAPGTYGRVVVPAGASCFSVGPVRIRTGLFVRSGA